MSEKKQTLIDSHPGVPRLIEMIENASLIGFDTEAHGPTFDRRRGKAKKMVNPYRATLTGFSVAVGDESFYIPVAHRVGRNLQLGDAHRILMAVKDHPALVAHNWKFDARVLDIPMELGGRLPDGALDSMVACWHRGKHAQNGRYRLKDLSRDLLGREMKSFEETVGKDRQFCDLDPVDGLSYAAEDAQNTLDLFRLMDSLGVEFFNVEMPFVQVLLSMENMGMGLDRGRLEMLREDAHARCEALSDDWAFLTGDVNIRSAVQLREIFPTEGLPKTPKGAPRMDKEAMNMLAVRYADNTTIGRLVRIKQRFQVLDKIRTTYTTSLIDEAGYHADGRLHPSFHHTGTATGRLSCSNPNLQNIPVRSDVGKAVKACFVPDPGCVYVSADYSQIELRVLAHLAGEGKLAAAYRDGIDIHQQTADLIKGSRDQGKTWNFATVYGAGPRKIAAMTDDTEEGAEAKMRRFKKGYAEIDRLKKRIIAAADQRGYVRTLLGRRRYIQNLRGSRGKRWAAERQAVNVPVQGGAADIVKLGMVDWHRRFGNVWPIVGQVHDEILIECPRDDAPEAARALQAVMENAYELNVPLVAEPVIGNDWGATK